MKTVWVCGLFSLLSIVAYSQISVALSGAGHPVGAIALDASSGRPAPGSTRNDNQLAAGISEYVFLHKAWNESLSDPTGAGLGVPWRWLRLYAVTQRPTENR